MIVASILSLFHRQFVIQRAAFVLPGLVLSIALVASSTVHAETRPNVVLIISDDQGAGDYGFMGHPHIQTPHIDRLAKESLTFTRGFVPTSVCCPSLATIITGLYPHQHKITANDPPLPGAADAKIKGGRGSSPELTTQWNAMLDEVPTLPRLLASRNYFSFQTGKWWQGDFSRGGFTHGMTEGIRHGDKGLTIGREGLQPIFDFIAESRKQEKPFFVWYAPFMPHSPHTPPERLFAKYANKTDSPHVARYWAMCELFDETCGALLNHLDQEKLSENTIVIYVTDNGWIQSPSSAGFAPKNKTTPYDAGHRTPIMVKWPGHVAPVRSSSVASSIDIAPTLLAAIGVPIPKELRGVNLLDNKSIESRKYVFGEDYTIRSQTLDDPAANVLWRWVTDGRWWLIIPRTFEATGPLKSIPSDKYLRPDLEATLISAQPMLYDLQADPSEDKNIAEAHPEIVATLRQELDKHWAPKVIVP
ncbi:MAG: sulfatase [Planctomycetota bacterium]|nr:sulfatase [Planctomycetota bacterium]